MKRAWFRVPWMWAACTPLLLVLTGCTTPTGEPSYTGTGALVGGASGAGLGALIAHEDPGVGALVGGAAGLITGGLIGSAMDQQARAQAYVPGPPPAVTETVPPSPGPNYMWTRGQWVWNGYQWIWNPGRWVVAPAPQAVWVAPGWVRGPYGWYWEPGHWQ